MRIHPEEELLESYALGRLSDDETATVEEHLIECDLCRDRLVELEDFVTAWKSAAESAPRPAKVLPFRVPRPVIWAPLAVAAALILGVFAYWSPNTRPVEPAVLMLQPLRGVEKGAQAQAQRPLVLTMEVPPQSVGPYEVEVVDIDGATLFSRTPQAGIEKLTVQTEGLAEGNYWVRLYQLQPSRELLQEFRLQLHDK
jgi:hypothetical protein